MLQILIAGSVINLRLIIYLNSHYYVIFIEGPLWWHVTQRCDSELLQFRPLPAISAVRTCSTHVSANIHDASLPYWATFWHHSLHSHTPGLLLSCTEAISPTECNNGIIQKFPELKNMTTTSGNTGTIVSWNTPRLMPLLSGVVVTFLSSIVVLTPNGQILDCVTIVFCGRHARDVQMWIVRLFTLLSVFYRNWASLLLSISSKYNFGA